MLINLLQLTYQISLSVLLGIEATKEQLDCLAFQSTMDFTKLDIPHELTPRNPREERLFNHFGKRLSQKGDILWMPVFVYGSDKGLITRPTLLYKTVDHTFIIDARDQPDYDYSGIYPWLTYIHLTDDTIPEIPIGVDVNNEIKDGTIFANQDDYRLCFHVLRRAFVDANAPMRIFHSFHKTFETPEGKVDVVRYCFNSMDKLCTTELHHKDGALFISRPGKMMMYAKIKN